MTFILPGSAAPKEKSPSDETALDESNKWHKYCITVYLTLLLLILVLGTHIFMPLVLKNYQGDKLQHSAKNVHKRSLDELLKTTATSYGQNLTELEVFKEDAIKKEAEIQNPIAVRIRRGAKQVNESSFEGVIQLHTVTSTKPDKRMVRNAPLGFVPNNSFPWSALANTQHEEQQSRMGKVVGSALMKTVFINASFPRSAVENTQHDEQQSRMGRVEGGALMGTIFINASFPESAVANTQHDERQPSMRRVEGGALMSVLLMNSSFPGTANASKLGGGAQYPRMVLRINRALFGIVKKHDMKEPSLLRIRRGTQKSKDGKVDAYEPFVVMDSSPCKPPTGLQTAEVLCKIWPHNTICISYCAYGKTFDEGIKRVHACSHNENRWSKLFEECKPFVDCKLRLIAPGNLNCKGNELNDSPSCTVSCDRYEDQDEVISQTYQCKADGSWQPKLPVCVTAFGTPLARAPDVKEHSNIAYPEAPKKS